MVFLGQIYLRLWQSLLTKNQEMLKIRTYVLKLQGYYNQLYKVVPNCIVIILVCRILFYLVEFNTNPKPVEELGGWVNSALSTSMQTKGPFFNLNSLCP